MFEKMTRIRPLILALTAAFLLGSCGNSSSSSGGGNAAPGGLPVPSDIPDNIDQSKPTAAKLTQDQKDHFVWHLRTMKGPLLADLVWVDPEEKPEDRQRREQELANSSIEVRGVVSEIKNNCFIQHPTTVTATTGNEIKPGTKIHSVMSGAIRTGQRACAIEASKNGVNDAIVTSFDKEKGVAKFTLTGTIDQNHRHSTSAAVSATGLRGGEIHMKLAGAMEYGGGGNALFVRFVGTTKLVPDTGEDVEMGLEGQILASEADRKNDMILHLRMTYDDVDYVLTVINKDVNGVATSEFYLNGDRIDDPGVDLPKTPSTVTPPAHVLRYLTQTR